MNQLKREGHLQNAIALDAHQYELNISEPPALLEPGDLLKISGKLKNISGRDWDIFIDDKETIKIGIQVYEENKPGRLEFRRSLGVDKFFDGATIEFECVIETKPLQQGKIRLVFDLVAEGRYWFEDKGAKPETIIVQVLPRTAGNLIRVGNQLKREGKLIEAIAEYRRAIELNSDFSWVYFNLGDALAKRGYINEAIAEYRRAIKLNPNSACFNYQLGELLALQKHDDQALYYLQKGVEIKYFDRFDTVLRKILAKQKNKIYPLHNICLYLNDLELERIQKIKKFKPSKDFIFITARYRTGSTYLYSLFSSLHDVLAFYEPLNPDLIYWLDQDASSTKESKILQNHTFNGNYFEEYKLLDRKTLIKNYSENFANSRMTMLSVENFNQLKNYMQFLLSSQVGLNKLKVLQFNRIDFRLSWFKFNFPNALIINLRRKSRDVYASYIGVYERLNKKTYEPLKTDLGNFFYLDDYIEFLGNISIPRFNKDELNNYEKIYLVNQLSNLWANKFADLVINYESLVDDPIETLSKIVSYIPNFELNFKENIIEPKKDRVNVGQDYHSEDWFKQCEERCDRLIAEILSFGKIYNNQDGEYAISQKLV
ncbi:TPR repeat-containing thioredoxin TTL2 [Planktothrix rubescens]|nr:TPR repeat-containing thioredoxin TTL2 [Planktothrix rubescens]